MPVRESVSDKAGRLLVSGSLCILELTDDRITAEIGGDTGSYRLGFHPRVRSGWFCQCPARVPCSHLFALWSVIDRERWDGGASDPADSPVMTGLRTRTLAAIGGSAHPAT